MNCEKNNSASKPSMLLLRRPRLPDQKQNIHCASISDNATQPEAKFHNTVIKQQLQRKKKLTGCVALYVNGRSAATHIDRSTLSNYQYSMLSSSQQASSFHCSTTKSARNSCTPSIATSQHPESCFNDLVSCLTEIEDIPIRRTTVVMYSRCNYKKIQSLLAKYCYETHQDSVNFINLCLANEVKQIPPRIPPRQLLLELVQLVEKDVKVLDKEALQELSLGSDQIKSDFSNHCITLSDSNAHREMPALQTSNRHNGRDGIIYASRTRVFQGSFRSSSPFNADDSDLITPAEVAVLDTLMNGGNSLSLKAHFLLVMPDIYILQNSLVHIDLSYNCFEYIPDAIFSVYNLQVLNFRSNPIQNISGCVEKLSNLRSLDLSHCLLETLPSQIFLLKQLEVLGLSYNKLEKIPSDIHLLENLVELGVDGNFLLGLPAGVQLLNKLCYLSIENNLMHSLFWMDGNHNNPQSLKELCLYAIHKSNFGSYLCRELQDVLERERSTCDCCGGSRFGQGLRLMKVSTDICGVKNVPILFNSCSVECMNNYKAFRHKKN